MAPFFAALARRAAAAPELPWLFFRRDLDWRWRSHRQVADHLARAAAVIRAAPGSAATALPLVGVEALAALFATLAAGKDFVPLEAADAGVPLLVPADAKWPDLVPEGWQGEIVTLPACRGNLERYPPEPLPSGPWGRLVGARGAATLDDLEAGAATLAARLFAPEAAAGIKNIVHAGARLASRDAAALLIASLEGHGTVLALEPYPPATVESVLWCRPTHLVATTDELEGLAAAWTGKAPRRSRLRRVVATGQPVAATAVAARLGVPVATLED